MGKPILPTIIELDEIFVLHSIIGLDNAKYRDLLKTFLNFNT